jgi:hypothetical protein
MSIRVLNVNHRTLTADDGHRFLVKPTIKSAWTSMESRTNRNVKEIVPPLSMRDTDHQRSKSNGS